MPPIALGQRGAFGAAAGIGVLDDGRRRRVKLGDQLPGGVQIHQVVVRELFAVQLFGARDTGAAADIKRRRLMRVFAVTQCQLAGRTDIQDRRQRLRPVGGISREAGADGAIVSRRGCESFLRQAPKRFARKRRRRWPATPR